MKNLMIVLMAVATLSSCVGSKKFKTLDANYTTLKADFEKMNSNFANCSRDLDGCRNENAKLKEDLDHCKKMSDRLSLSVGEMALLSKKEAENLQKSMQNIQEKDLKITELYQALSRKDSVTLALVTSLKGAVGINDQDITISVEKGVVFVSISDKFLFKSGSYQINDKAKEVLAKVALILNDKKEMEVMIEGHTDNVPYRSGELIDNWDLSVKRSTALVRMLQKEYQIAPARMVAAGRGEYVPVATNDTKEGKAANRRTRIIIMPKLEQFFGMIEEGMKK